MDLSKEQQRLDDLQAQLREIVVLEGCGMSVSGALGELALPES